MSSKPKADKFRRYRERLKENNREKYQESLKKAKERNKRNRDARKMRFSSEPQTPGLLQEIQNFTEKERQRWRDYYAKKKHDNSATRKSMNSLRASTECRPPGAKRPKDMAGDKLRARNRILKELSRKRETPKKIWWRKKKDREHKQKKRVVTQMNHGYVDTPATLPESADSQSNPVPCSPVKKSEYNLLSSWRNSLKKKTPTKFARLVKNLATNTKCPQKREALRSEGLQSQSNVHKNSQKKLEERLASLRKKFLPRKKRKQRKDSLSESNRQTIRHFFCREDISRALPSKRYTTKHGPGYVMQQTLRQAHKLFIAEHPSVKVGYTRFTLLRPKNVRKVSSTFLDTCQCVYCLNIRLKVLAMNRLISKDASLDNAMRVEDERGVYKMVLCDKDDDAPFHRSQCIQGTCEQCSNPQQALERHYQPLLDLNPNVSWSKWVRGSGAGREPAVETGSVRELMKELVADVVAPARNTSFVKHLFTAHWQHCQYRELKSKLRVGQVLVVMDFAENKKNACQDEIKSAHFNKTQFSFHPVVAFYRTHEGADIVRHALDFVSDDTKHDFHCVHHFTTETIQYFKDQGVLHAGCELFVFSDNCAAQYKCKGTFADLSQYTEPVQRIYFGAEHGKGEADGETGVVSKAVETAMLCRQVQIRGAQDFFNWCQANLTKDSPQSKRQFVFVTSEDIKRDRPESEVKTVTGSRKFHQVLRVAPMTVKSREFVCFCASCLTGNGACTNRDYVGTWAVHQLQPLVPRDHRTQKKKKVSRDDDCHSHREPSPPPVPREDFFAALQQDLMRSRSNFGTFTACVQECERRASSYPLPFPVMEPEFQRDEVDQIADNQRPDGAAPPSHFALNTIGDGNCLPRALSAAAFGSDAHHVEMRVRIVCELALRKMTYLSPEHIARGSQLDGEASLMFYHQTGDFYGVPSLQTALECEIMSVVENSKDMGGWQFSAAANVLGSKIHSIYPEVGADELRQQIHRVFQPEQESHVPLYIQWTSNLRDMADLGVRFWKANHFVPVVKDRNHASSASIHIGDFVTVTFDTGVHHRGETYRAIVIPPPEEIALQEAGDLVVKLLRPSYSGRFFVFPSVDDISIVHEREVSKSPYPTINKRGHHFF